MQGFFFPSQNIAASNQNSVVTVYWLVGLKYCPTKVCLETGWCGLPNENTMWAEYWHALKATEEIICFLWTTDKPESDCFSYKKI